MEEVENNYVTVSADKATGMIARIQVGDHQFKIDESGLTQDINTNPDPYDYIMSALGACTVITLQMYAQRKQWPLERVEVKLKHQRVYIQDCKACEDDKTARISQITKKLKLVGELTPEQRKRLKVISSRCPVQKSLEAGLSIETLLE